MVTPDGPSQDIPQWRVTAGTQEPSTVDRLLRSLPEWFGIETATVDYVESARRLPTYLAWPPSGTRGGGPSHPDTAYAATRRFYDALGFLPLEEIHGLWPGNPCLVMVKPLR